MQVEINHIQHLGVEVRIGTVQPVMPAMRLDGRLIEETPHGGSADGLNDTLLGRGMSQVRGAPVGDRDAVFNRRPGGQGDNLMLLVRGKKRAACLDEAGL